MLSNENVVNNSIVEAAAPDLAEVDYNDFEQLKVAANQFITKVENMINRMRHTHQLIQSKTSIKNSLTIFYQLMRQSTQFTQEALVLQHAFETQLNNFLGRKIYLGWVNDEGHILYFDQANIGRLYANATANRGRGNISASKMKDMIDVNDLQDDLQKRLEESERLRAHVYNIAVARWSGNEEDETIKDYNPSKKTFYWKLIDNHHISGWTKPIATKGAIAEGYAGAVINEDPNIRFYIKDEAKEQERQKKIVQERSTAMRNFVELSASDSKFDAVYLAVCINRNDNLAEALLKDKSIKQAIVMNYVNDNPDKFNKIVNDKNIVMKAFIETLILRGELVRTGYNQQISTPEGEVIGANMNDAVAWFNNPNNNAARMVFENKLKLS